MERRRFLKGSSSIFKHHLKERYPSKFNNTLLNICDMTNIHFHYFSTILFQHEKKSANN
jgi:hypothetical protein